MAPSYSYALPLAVCAVLSITACGSDAAPRVSTIVTDSAGIRIVHAASPLWAERPSEAWAIEIPHAMEISGDFGDPDHFLFGAHYLHRMEDGRLVVGNRGSRQLLVFDSLGQFIGPVGQPGQGPGEFERVFGLFACALDSIVVDEGSRISIWDSDLEFVRNERTSGRLVDGSSNIRGVSADCSSGLFPNQVYETPVEGQGVLRLPSLLHWSTLDGDSRDTIAEFPGVETYPWTIPGQVIGTRLPFGKDAVWAVLGDDVFLGLEESFELSVYDRTGVLTQIMRWEAQRQRVEDADRALFENARQQYIDAHPDEAFLYAPLEHFPVPEFKPAYSRLLPDDDGNLWVQQYRLYNPFEPDIGQDWWVFDPTGVWLGEIELPLGLDVRAIQDGLVIGVARDDLDVEHIRFHRIIRP